MCVIRALFLAALLALLTAAQTSPPTDQSSKADAGARIDDNGAR